DEQLAGLRRQRAEVKGQAPAVDAGINEMAQEHRARLLELGTAGRLAIQGGVEVLPLYGEVLLDQAKPVTPDGRVVIDAAKMEARHDAQVKAALANGPCSVLLLGGAHDLQRWAGGRGPGSSAARRWWGCPTRPPERARRGSLLQDLARKKALL